MITWTIGAYTVTWDGSGKVTVTITATSQFVLSYAASTFQAAISAPELTAILQPLPLSSSGLQLMATTGAAGFALQNATSTILSWTAPADGNLHRVNIESLLVVSSAETGGAIQLTAVDPLGASHNYSLISASLGAGGQRGTATFIAVQAGSTVTVNQQSALTVGAAILWAEIWAS